MPQKFERSLGYCVIADGQSSLACSFGDFLEQYVGRSYSWLSVAIDVDLTPIKLRVLEESLGRTRRKFFELVITSATVEKLSSLRPCFCGLQIDRLVVSPKPGFDEISLRAFIDSLLLQDIWVETKGVPYCMTYIEHVWENYNRCEPSFEKGPQCDGCLFKDACRRVDTRNLPAPHPIKESSVIGDFLKFVGESA